MKKILLASALGFAFVAGAVVAEPVRDWHDLDKVHRHVLQSINEMERARAANHYDMAGHGARAEALLRQAEGELAQAVNAARSAP